MKLIIRNWCFSPELLTSLLAAVFISLFVSLGYWQLDRADYKRALYAEFENRQASTAVDLNQDYSGQLSTEELLWRPVRASGEFLEAYQILLDNQVSATHAGYYVYTPFKLAKNGRVVLVNRGWLVADADRSVSPELVSTTGVVSINAIAKQIPKTGLLLKDLPPEQMSATVYRVQRINIAELGELTNLDLLPYVLRLEADSGHGYLRQWRVPGSGEKMHLGYAFQWFAFALSVLIIYLVLNIKKMRQDK